MTDFAQRDSALRKAARRVGTEVMRLGMAIEYEAQFLPGSMPQMQAAAAALRALLDELLSGEKGVE